MIGYVTIGTNDLQKAAAFFDDLLSMVGATRTMSTERFIAWGKGRKDTGLGVTMPFDGNPATVGNGVMVALEALGRPQVDAVYKKALALGATDEGAPGLREDGPPNFYAGYFRDLDGNKFNIFTMAA